MLLQHQPADSRSCSLCGGKKKDAGLSLRDQRYITLMRLRKEIDEDMLADRLQLKQYSISRLETSWIHFIYLLLPPAFSKHYPCTFIIFYCSEIQCDMPDFLQSAPTFANVQLVSYKAHTTLYLERPCWYFELSRSYHLCSQVKCNMSNGCATLSRCVPSWKLIYHFDFSLLFDMNFIHVLASYIHT